MVSNSLLFDTAAVDIFYMPSCAHVLEFLQKCTVWWGQIPKYCPYQLYQLQLYPEFLFLCILFSIWYRQWSEHLSFFLAIQRPEQPSYIWRISSYESPLPTLDVSSLIPTLRRLCQSDSPTPEQWKASDFTGSGCSLEARRPGSSYMHFSEASETQFPEATICAGIGDTNSSGYLGVPSGGGIWWPGVV